jgi:hypothetical protein
VTVGKNARQNTAGEFAIVDERTLIAFDPKVDPAAGVSNGIEWYGCDLQRVGIKEPRVLSPDPSEAHGHRQRIAIFSPITDPGPGQIQGAGGCRQGGKKRKYRCRNEYPHNLHLHHFGYAAMIFQRPWLDAIRLKRQSADTLTPTQCCCTPMSWGHSAHLSDTL